MRPAPLVLGLLLAAALWLVAPLSLAGDQRVGDRLDQKLSLKISGRLEHERLTSQRRQAPAAKLVTGKLLTEGVVPAEPETAKPRPSAPGTFPWNWFRVRFLLFW